MNKSLKNRKRLGQALAEFTFVGIPIIFILISVFEVSRGMWMYHTLAYAVKNGTRYASVHGINCVGTSFNANSCAVSMGPSTTTGTVASVIAWAAGTLGPGGHHPDFYGCQRQQHSVRLVGLQQHWMADR